MDLQSQIFLFPSKSNSIHLRDRFPQVSSHDWLVKKWKNFSSFNHRSDSFLSFSLLMTWDSFSIGSLLNQWEINDLIIILELNKNRKNLIETINFFLSFSVSCLKEYLIESLIFRISSWLTRAKKKNKKKKRKTHASKRTHSSIRNAVSASQITTSQRRWSCIWSTILHKTFIFSNDSFSVSSNLISWVKYHPLVIGVASTN